MSWLLVLALPVALAQTPDLLPEVVTPSVETTWEAHHRAVGLAGDAADVVCADFAEGLRVCLRVREGPGTRPVTQADLDRWGLDPTAAQARAIRSIARGMTPDRPAEIQVEGDPRTYLLSAEGDGLDQAGLFSPDRLVLRAGGPVAIGIPARGVFIAFVLADPDLARIVAVGVRRAFETLPDPITDTLYTWNGQAWIPWGRGRPASEEPPEPAGGSSPPPVEALQPTAYSLQPATPCGPVPWPTSPAKGRSG
ncbi:MAG: hypothetical protein JXB39_10480 [Deltaproteobacteria bacterium]|nr:hypothetical protein [Deltaproteobacteria bacterium]